MHKFCTQMNSVRNLVGNCDSHFTIGDYENRDNKRWQSTIHCSQTMSSVYQRHCQIYQQHPTATQRRLRETRFDCSAVLATSGPLGEDSEKTIVEVHALAAMKYKLIDRQLLEQAGQVDSSPFPADNFSSSACVVLLSSCFDLTCF